MYFCADQKETLTIRPPPCSTMRLAARREQANAARTPASIIASQRHSGCSQNGFIQVNSPFSTMFS